MDLLDKIQRSEFLGSEFLLFLWFASDVCESELTVGGRTLGLFVDDQLVLVSPGDATEKTTLRGVAPALAPEAREALRQGKLPIKAHVGMTLGERSFAFTLDAMPFAIAGVKLPDLVNEAIDERFYERMMLLDELEHALWELLSGFIHLRLSRTWTGTLLPSLQAWVREDPAFDPDDTRRRLTRALRAGSATA